MKRSILSLILCVVLLFTVIVGCSNSKDGDGNVSNNTPNTGVDTNEPTDDDNINLDSMNLPIIKDPSKFPKMKMLVVSPPDRVVKVGDMIQVKRLEEETGVIFDWQEIPEEGSNEKINLMLASRDLPDAFWNGISNEMIVQYMGQDVFIPTEELTEKYMPRLTEIYEKRPQYKAAATAPDGHRYGFPYIEEMYGLVLTPGPFLINKDWLEKVGKDMPTTVDEWVDVLRAFRDGGDLNGNGQDDEIPYALGLTSKDMFGSYNTFHMFTGCFGQSDTYGGRPEDHMAIKDGKVIFTAIDEAYKETAKFFHELNKEGLIDVDSFSPHPSGEGSALYLDKIKGSEAVIGCFGVWAPVNEIPDLDVRAQYVPLPRLEGPKGKMGHALNFSEMQNAGLITITTECQYPEVIACFTDYLFEPEISITTNWGPIDYIYVKGDDGILHFDLDENNNIVLKDGFKTFGEMRNNSTPARGAMAVLNEYYGTIADYTWDAADLLEFQRVNGKEEILAEANPVPRMLMTVEEQNRVSQIQPQVKNIVTSYTMQWILDGGADETWDNYISELKAAGLDDLLATYQQAYDRYIQNME